jgi:hypothetical protein
MRASTAECNEPGCRGSDRRRTPAVGILLWCLAAALALPGAHAADDAKGKRRQQSAAAVEKVPQVTSLEPAQVLRGMPVKITGSDFDQATEIRVSLNGKEILLDKPRGDDAKSLTFRVPLDFPLGHYTVRVHFLRGNRPPLIAGVPIPSQKDQLSVISDSAEKLKVTSIDPIVGYPDSGKFSFRVLGEGFSTVPSDNELFHTDHRYIPVTWVDKLPDVTQSTPDTQNKVYGRVVSTRELEFAGIPQSEHQGRLKFQIRVGDSVSDPVPATFAVVKRGVPWAVALGVVVLLGVLVYLPVTWRLRRYRVGDRDYRAWSVFLLDQATDTLSLSKFQLYVWTTVAVFGYTYLTVARSLIQGVFEFAQIPDNLPAILGVSVGTAALASGVNSVRGPKGAGEEGPSFADLITSGGVVVAERFQFLVWTVLGALAFLFLVVFSDPATIHDLPKIPEGFLYLMGVSSAGYLGGKLARKPGPVIDTIVAQHGSIVIDIQGRNLSREAIFSIDERAVTYDLMQGSASAPPPGSAKDAALEVVRRDPDASDKDFSLALRLTIKDEHAWLADWRKADPQVKADDDWLDDTHRLSLMNPDGQKAVLSFTLKASAADRERSRPENPAAPLAPASGSPDRVF